jgi:WD40 repeat protein
MLTKGGVKVLDFGLAARRAPSDGSVLDPALAGSKELTVEGRIMGTVPYMAPEQLQGRPTDARTDVFAFGAVAYEMLTGKPAFSADSQADLIGAILKDDPESITSSAADVPIVLARTIARCLAKDPHERWQTAADLVFQLRSIAESAGVPVQGSKRSRWSHRTERALWLAAVAASFVLGVYLWGSRGSRDARPAPAPGAVRFPLLPPKGTTFPSSFDVPFALSPDGRRIVYAAVGDDGTRYLWLRSLDSERERPLAGTAGANSPFWSHDSEWVAFFSAGTLKKVRVTSPIAQVIEIARTTWSMGGAAWSRNDIIVFPGQGGLHRVSANGGPVSRIGNDKNFHLWPQFLADGQRYIYSSFTPRTLLLGSLAGEPPRTLMTFPVNVSGLAYASGAILFVQDGVLFARPFDERSGEFAGDARRIVDGIPVTGPGRAPFSVSAAGVLAFWTNASGATARLKWFTRNGESSPALDAPAKYFGFALSPDGRRLAFSRVGSNGEPDLWVRNLEGGDETQLTFDGAGYTPQWSPDGSQILFTGIAERPPPRLFIKDVARPGAAQPLDAGPGPQFASSWSGHDLLSVIVGSKPGGYELMVQRVEGGRPEPSAINTADDETEGSLSSNGQWLAYTTDQTGRDEVWVASFPSGRLRRQLSVNGGISPCWCDGENAIVYLGRDKRLTAVPFRGSAERIDLGDRQALFTIDDVVQFDRRLAPTANYYAATADCRRFLVATKAPDLQPPPINIVVNWPALLER